MRTPLAEHYDNPTHLHHRIRMRLRAQYIQAMRGRTCSKCGAEGPLDWHHIDPARKSFHLHNYGTRGWNTIKEEVAKCVPLCKPCHRKEHRS